MAVNQYTGEAGEQMAVEYLLEAGYEIMERNYRVGYLEIDIIARKDEVVHIVEVKTRSSSRSSGSQYTPEAALTGKKLSRVMKAAESYISAEGVCSELSVDLIAINVDLEFGTQIRHYSGVQWM